jgi:hypothetical protein
MIRWIALLAVLLLSGCATGYRGYYEADRGTYVGDRSYYVAEARPDRGDYYYGSYAAGYQPPLWMEYPYYYSLFWPLQRWSYDPYWHPGFYYGVTFFPRNYFALNLYGGRYHGHRPYWSLAYSPYRLSWVDSYYDWYPYHRHTRHHRHHRHHQHHYAPRYGNARHESERLARHWGDGARDQRWRGERHDRQQAGLPRDESRHYGTRGVPHNPARDADRHSRPSGRSDPGLRGFERGPQQRAESARLREPRDAEQAAALRQRPALQDERGNAARGELRTLDQRREIARQQRVAPREPMAERSWQQEAQARRAIYEADRSAHREVARPRVESFDLPGRRGVAPQGQPWSARSAAVEPRDHRPVQPARGYAEPREEYRAPAAMPSRPIAREVAGYREAPPPRAARHESAAPPAQYQPQAPRYDAPVARQAPQGPRHDAPVARQEAPAPRHEAPVRDAVREEARTERAEARSESRGRREARYEH